jgi:hypothetical protein
MERCKGVKASLFQCGYVGGRIESYTIYPGEDRATGPVRLYRISAGCQIRGYRDIRAISDLLLSCFDIFLSCMLFDYRCLLRRTRCNRSYIGLASGLSSISSVTYDLRYGVQFIEI